jgi:hypothetical protein
MNDFDEKELHLGYRTLYKYIDIMACACISYIQREVPP